jgi:Tfp pilus assembly protein PilO
MRGLFMKGGLHKERASLIIILLVTWFLFYIWLFSPLSKRVDAVKAEVQRLKEDEARYQMVASSTEREARKLEEIMETYRAMEEGLLFVKERLPSVRDISAILREVSGQHPGVTFISIQPLSIEDKGMYLRFPVAIQMRGDFPSLGRYISSIDLSNRLIGIENINMVREGQDGILMKADLSVYLLKEGAL